MATFRQKMMPKRPSEEKSCIRLSVRKVAIALAAFQLSVARYDLNQLRYDLRKMKAHGLVERDGKRYAYRLTEKGTKVALTFVLFHHRLCGPLANSLFHHQPDSGAQPNSKLEAAYYKADASIRNLIQLIEAA
jgi:Ribonuclease R winged-helix domain